MQNSVFVKRFINAAEAWVCDEYSIEFRYVAVRTQFGPVILEAAVSLVPLPIEGSPEIFLSTETLVAGRIQINRVGKLDAMRVLRDAISGKIKFEGIPEVVGFVEGLDYDSEMVESDRWFMPLHLAVLSPGTDYPHQVTLASIDSELRRADPPFDGVSDLFGWLAFGFRKLEEKTPRIVLTVGPPVDLVFDKSSLSDGNLKITINAHSNLDLGLINIAVMGFPGDGVASRRQIKDLIVWEEPSDGIIVGKVDMFMANCDSVMVIVGVKSDIVRRQMIIDPPKSRNQRFLAMSRFDDDFKKLKFNLFENQNTKDFEIAITSLLFLLGFSAAMPLESNSPDIVVSTPIGRIVIVECTTRLDDYVTKLGKLVQRRSLLSEAFAKAGLPGPAIAVLVCRLPRKDVLLKMDTFVENDVIYFGAEDIESSLVQARYMLNPDAMLNEALASMRSFGRIEAHEDSQGD